MSYYLIKSLNALKRRNLFFILILLASTSYSQVDSSELITVHEILIKGNRKTKPQIITRELSFKEGKKYQRIELDSMFVWDRNRIYNTNLFNEITFSIENRRNGSADILITLDERWYFYPIPIFKLVDRNLNDWWVNRNRDLSRVNIGLRITQYNFRGRAERLRLSAQFGFETRLNFGYRIPYIEKTQRHGLNFNFSYVENKNLAFDTENNVRSFLEGEELLRTAFSNSVTHSFRNSFYSFHFFSLNHSSVHIADTIAALNPNYLGTMEGENGKSLTSQKSIRLGYSYAWDKRNNRNYPTDGEWYTASINKYGLGLYDDIDFVAADFRLSRYRELGKNWYYAGNLAGFFSTPEERDYFNFFAIGFRRTVLRGYDLTIVEGSSYFIQKNEIKKLFFSHTQDISRVMPIRQFQTFPIKLFGKVFFDQGYAKGYPGHDGSQLLDNRYLYSYGIGLDVMLIYDAVFRFELSQNTLGQTNFFINFGTAL